MRLTEIRLAGFKSFVDPTHIRVPGRLVGVVGPNGCGKSNVIDAVRWVLGETSARHLRGETMQDVIFNGSGQRKPVSRASAELVFDNNQGKAGGQWASYAEISVKRVLERDGNSAYFVNGAHVRRRDVQDIFLGTGLGGRAYAIIEQGMISRIIEAKPEELRVFLEEAAGVSKYRERRRETELRLADTRRNLARAEDILRELTDRLTALEGQAQVAEQYRELQSRLQTAQNLLWLTKKQEAQGQQQRFAQEAERMALEAEAETARLREAETRLERFRQSHYAATDGLQAAQGELYAAGAEVARIEQALQHLRENRQRAEQRIGAVEGELERQRHVREEAEAGLAHWRRELSHAEERLLICQERLAREGAALPAAEELFREAQQRVQTVQQEGAAAQQSVQLEEARRQHAEKILAQLAERRVKLADEQRRLPHPDPAQLENDRAALRQLTAVLEETARTIAHREAMLPNAEAAVREQRDGAADAERRLAALEARLGALEMLQSRVTAGERAAQWLTDRGLEQGDRLWQEIRIEPGWEDALEAVLRERLNGIAVSRLEEAGAWLADGPPSRTALYQSGASGVVPAPAEGLKPLRGMVHCRSIGPAAALDDWLQGVYVAQDTAELLALRPSLPVGALAVCPQGHCATRHSLSFHAPDAELHGVLARQREIEGLRVEVADLRREAADRREVLEELAEELESRRGQIAALRQESEAAQGRFHGLQLEVVRLTEQAQRVAEREAQIHGELRDVEQQAEREQAERRAAEFALVRCRGEWDAAKERLAQARENYRELEQALAERRQTLRQAEREVQEAGFQVKSCAAKIQELEGSRLTAGEQSARLEAERDSLLAERQGYDETDLSSQLQAALASRVRREAALAEARGALEEAEQGLRQADQDRLAAEQRIAACKDRMAELRLKEQEARLTAEQYGRQLFEAGADEAALAALSEREAKPAALQGEIGRLQHAITELGAVNLAAVEELRAGRERQAYLQSQGQDLAEATATLEDAIRRIDQETRQRLQGTFDAVNVHIADMFPALFGGGQARLVMTGEEILDAGVQVMAQPPGKKNASIHLLSGGEKALTALALVFALFQLNPAPFCLLDEVDAPLDDTNTERFCRLLQRMAEHTQFVFISHNKLTMEIAEQLIGVTMQELGVSRVVAVDVEGALRLTEEHAA